MDFEPDLAERVVRWVALKPGWLGETAVEGGVDLRGREGAAEDVFCVWEKECAC